jgi:hypothetical protein
MDTLLDQCSGTVIVHVDQRPTCSDSRCNDASIGRRMLDRHGWFVACSEALGTSCPVCGVRWCRRDPDVRVDAARTPS